MKSPILIYGYFYRYYAGKLNVFLPECNSTLVAFFSITNVKILKHLNCKFL